MPQRTCRWPSANAPACQRAWVVARTVCHQHPARNRRTAVRGGPPAAGGTEVDELLEFVTGQTMEMTGADLVVLALPGEGHRQLTIRHAADRRQLPSVTRSLGWWRQRNWRKNSRTSPIRRSGASRAAKWPPRLNSAQCTTLWSRSARGRRVMSLGNTATAIGTGDFGRGWPQVRAPS